MQRRTFLAATAALAAPSIARAQSASVFKFIPQTDLNIFDPLWTPAYPTRAHAYMVYDTLYGQSGARGGYAATPQMVAGHVIEDDGKTWKLTLRDGLMFHDGTKVLARDCVASIKRWGVRDTMGQALMARTNEIFAQDDKTIVFRLKKPFALLPDALGKCTPNICVIHPERIAATDPFKAITTSIGSGPFKFKADEMVAGAHFAWERNASYVPRADGLVEWTSGPKIVHFDRIEWHVIPDQATAAAAMKSGEMDGWEQPSTDLLPLMDREAHLKRENVYDTGIAPFCRPNHLYPPFNNAAIRRALLPAIDQEATMIAAVGDDPTLRKTPCGFFPIGSPMASNAGMQNILPKPDYDLARRLLHEAGYQGEPVVLMGPSDIPMSKAFNDIVADCWHRAGVNVDYQVMDFGTMAQRRASKKPPAEGGWNALCTNPGAIDFFNPGTHYHLRGNGEAGMFGWSSSQKIEDLRDAWLDAPDLASQKKLAADIQAQAFIDVPYYPLGLLYSPSVYRRDVTDIVHGFAMFWNMKRAA